MRESLGEAHVAAVSPYTHLFHLAQTIQCYLSIRVHVYAMYVLLCAVLCRHTHIQTHTSPPHSSPAAVPLDWAPQCSAWQLVWTVRLTYWCTDAEDNPGFGWGSSPAARLGSITCFLCCCVYFRFILLSIYHHACVCCSWPVVLTGEIKTWSNFSEKQNNKQLDVIFKWRWWEKEKKRGKMQLPADSKWCLSYFFVPKRTEEILYEYNIFFMITSPGGLCAFVGLCVVGTWKLCWQYFHFLNGTWSMRFPDTSHIRQTPMIYINNHHCFMWGKLICTEKKNKKKKQ